MTRRLAGRSALLLGVLALGSSAFAWGPQGHRVIARAAYDRLTPEAKAAIRELLLEGDTMASVADWADHDGYEAVPGSGPWHYVNVPIDEKEYQARFGGAKGAGVVEKIKHFRNVLADRSEPKRERQRALLFLIHFVADLHQPLHVGDNHDHGGNDTQIQFFGRGTNLHRVWDSDLLHHIGGDDRAWTERVERLITPRTVAAWSGNNVDAWATETLQVAKLAYHNPEAKGELIPRLATAGPIPTGTTLGEGYVRMADPILREQMARASVRLANELNAILR